jgi:tetratricopeptide (TPR) repeat protein
MMKSVRSVSLSALLVVMACVGASAQVDDFSQAIGLPLPIGSPVIYGQVNIRNMPRDQRRPTIDVSLRAGGSQIEKSRANDRGYYYFLRRPSDGQQLVFYVDGAEVGQIVLTAGLSPRQRQDVEFDWNALRGSTRTATGVVSARDRYERSDESNKAFEKALAAASSNGDEALKLFTAITNSDEKDYNAWLQIGIIHYNAKRFDEARAAYGKAIALKPDYFVANLNLGKLELSQKNYEPAIVAFSNAVKAVPDSADANHLLGETLLQNKRGSLAVGFLNRAIELDPVGKAEVHLRLATLYNAAGYKDRAAMEYKAFLKKVKDHPDRKKFEQYVKENLPKT